MYVYTSSIPSLIPSTVQSDKDKARVVIEEINKATLETLKYSPEHKAAILEMRALAVKAVSSVFQLEVTGCENLMDFLSIPCNEESESSSEGDCSELSDSGDCIDAFETAKRLVKKQVLSESEEDYSEEEVKIAKRVPCTDFAQLRHRIKAIENVDQAIALGKEIHKNDLLTRRMICFASTLSSGRWRKDILSGYDNFEKL